MRRKRLIEIGKNITLMPKILPGVGLRETVLLGVAALQAVYFIFYVESWLLGLRLTVALLIALPILVIATVPFHGLHFERWLWGQIAGALEPKRLRHATADPRRARFADAEADVSDGVEDEDEGEDVVRRAVATNTGARALVLDAPNLGVVMAAFLCLLLFGSLLVYATRGAAALP